MSGVTVTIGRVETNDLQFEGPTVSRNHCCIRWDDARSVYLLIDLGASNGTYLNGARLPERGSVLLLDPDSPPPTPPRIGLGTGFEFALEPHHLAKFQAVHAAPVGVRGATILSEELSESVSTLGTKLGGVNDGSDADPPSRDAVSLSIGADPANDVQLVSPKVSRRHATLYAEPSGRYLLEDRGSTNGTFVGGRRVVRAELRPGMAFSIGPVETTLDEGMVTLLQTRLRGGAAGARPALPSGLPSTITIGSHPTNTIVVSGAGVAGRHASLSPVHERHGYVVEQLADAPIGVQSPHNTIPSGLFVDADEVLYLGAYRLPLQSVPERVARRADDVDAIPIPAGASLFTVGRADVVNPVRIGLPQQTPHVQIAIAQVSRLHAVVRIVPGGFQIENHGANGTFIGGAPVLSTQTFPLGTEVHFGREYRLRFVGADQKVRRVYSGDIVLTARGLCWDAPRDGFRVLNNVDFTAYPSEFVGLMGPSGAGKTTLLKSLAGVAPATAGHALINGADVVASREQLQGLVGYVPQEDIVFPQLTVTESLRFTGLLRGVRPDTLDARITELLTALDITDIADKQIGDAVQKVISGGQRKRVNLAQELVTDPPLLLLDEPTSGLASEDTINVMRLLRRLADEGRTIVLTIHQPSLEAYREMDNILYLVRGRLVYYGPTFPDSLEFFNPGLEGRERDVVLSDPGHALRPIYQASAALQKSRGLPQADAEREVAAQLSARYAASPYQHDYVASRSGSGDADLVISEGGVQPTPKVGALRQTALLTWRTALVKLRDRQQTGVLMAQAPIIGLLLCAFAATPATSPFFNTLAREPAALFLMVAAAVWFGCNNAAREIVAEAPIFERERLVGLGILPYVIAKYVVIGGLCAAQCGVLLLILTFALKLHGSFLATLFVLWLVSLAGVGMGLFVSARVSRPPAAVSLVPILLIPQIVFGGAILGLPSMPSMKVAGVSIGQEVIPAFFASRWGYEAVLRLEYDTTNSAVPEVCDKGDARCTREALEDIMALCNEVDVSDTATPWTCAFTDSGDEPMYVPVNAFCVGDDGALAQSLDCRVGDPRSPTPLAVRTSNASQTCRTFCAALSASAPITPIDRAFGLDFDDPWRADALDRLGEVEGLNSARTSVGTATLMLILMNLALAAAVAVSLKRKDPA